MGWRKQRGDLAELKVAADLVSQGYRIAVPFGEDSSYDLIVCHDDGRFDRVQVKHARSNGEFIEIKCYSNTIVSGRVHTTVRYTSRTIDWLPVFDATSGRCLYVPAAELGTGRRSFTIRLEPPRGRWLAISRRAEDYATLHRAAAT